MESLTDPPPLDPELATSTHQAEERERVAFVLFMLLAIGVLLGFALWRVFFGGPEWKPATETWMQIEGVAVPMPDPWAVAAKESTRVDAGDRITEAAFRFEKGEILIPLAVRWKEFLVERGYEAEATTTGFGETHRMHVSGHKAENKVELDLRTWDRTGKLKMTDSNGQGE